MDWPCAKNTKYSKTKNKENAFFQSDFYIIYALLLNTTEIYMELNYLC